VVTKEAHRRPKGDHRVNHEGAEGGDGGGQQVDELLSALEPEVFLHDQLACVGNSLKQT